MVKVILHKTALTPQTDGSIIIARWRQCALPCGHWCQLANTTELVKHSANPSPQPKLQINRFSCFCTAHGRKSPYLTMATLSQKISGSHWGIDLDPHTIHDYLGQFEPIIQMALRSVGSGPPSITWFPGPTQVLDSNGISISSAILQGSLV